MRACIAAKLPRRGVAEVVGAYFLVLKFVPFTIAVSIIAKWDRVSLFIVEHLQFLFALAIVQSKSKIGSKRTDSSQAEFPLIISIVQLFVLKHL